MSVQRWKPSWAQGRMIPAGVHPVDGYVSAADHARVVAEMERAHAAALADANLRWDAEVTRALDEGEKIGRADAEQEHAAAWDRATFDSTAYEQGKRDAAEEARAAERRHWEARFRNAEQAHAAALAEAEAASTVAVGMTVEAALAECIVEVVRVDSFEDIAGHFLKDRDEVEDAIRRVFRKWANKAAAPRTLTADDPEPAVGSVAMDRIGVPWLARIGFGGMPVWASAGDTRSASWGRMHELFGPITLIHDGEDR